MLDSRAVVLRPIRPDDEVEHFELWSRLPPQDRRHRFFGAVSTKLHTTMERFTRIDYDREMAFIASAVIAGGEHETLGVVRTIADDIGDEAEFAIVIRSDLKHHGIGHALTEKAVRFCRQRGYRRLSGQVLPDNRVMIGFAKHEGFQIRRLMDEGVVEIILDL